MWIGASAILLAAPKGLYSARVTLSTPALAASGAPAQEIRDRRLARMIAHAATRVPYYRGRYGSPEPAPADATAALEGLPLTSRAELQALPLPQRLASGHRLRHLVRHRTSGSTGQPLEIARTWWEERRLGLARWRALQAYGWRPWHRHVEVEEPLRPDPRDRRWLHRAVHGLGLMRQWRVDALADAGVTAERIAAARPHVVTGYTGVLARLAGGRASSAEGASARLRGTAALRFVAGHSDTVTESSRSEILAGFGAPFYELYDCFETNLIAAQCPRSSGLCEESAPLHCVQDTTVVEVLVAGRPALPGETGEIVLTSLVSFAMPFVRYRLGDLAVLGGDRCRACGAPVRTLERIRGRDFDEFPLPDGRRLHPYRLLDALSPLLRATLQYRLVQEELDRIELTYVARRRVPEARRRIAEEAAVRLLGPGVGFRAVAVEKLEIPPGAKHRACESRVKKPRIPALRAAPTR